MKQPMKQPQQLSPIITLTTDFGLEDAFVGSMKGVMLSIQRHLYIVDISHGLPRHGIVPAALMLREVCPRFPDETIHVAVIDPGVGGPRRPVLLKIADHYFLGPDNGIFGLLLSDFALQGAWKLENQTYFLPTISSTFHGRDLFAPVAAHLAGGVPAGEFGPEITDPFSVQVPRHEMAPGVLKGEILWIDHFGNCITNLPESVISDWAQGAPVRIQAGDRTIEGISCCYEAVPQAAPLALISSTATLEIACNQDRADHTLGLNIGDPVHLNLSLPD